MEPLCLFTAMKKFGPGFTESRQFIHVPASNRFRVADEGKLFHLMDARAFKGSNDRLSRVDACKDEGHSDASSIKRVTSSSEDDCSIFSTKKGSLSAATKSRI
jgi:hypothetical protein